MVTTIAIEGAGASGFVIKTSRVWSKNVKGPPSVAAVALLAPKPRCRTRHQKCVFERFETRNKVSIDACWQNTFEGLSVVKFQGLPPLRHFRPTNHFVQ